MSKNKKGINVDKTAGSRSYNRLDMQVSQTLQMAIELYDNMNYLLVLDHYDDITLFDLDADPLVVCYYQLKTSDDKITIDSAINNDWIAKLYAQLTRPDDWFVKELGLITNIPIEVKYRIVGKDGKKKDIRDLLKNDRTSFTKLNAEVQKRITDDIAKKFDVSEDVIDLSKFTHMRTVKCIFTSMIDQAISISIPEFPQIDELLKPSDKEKANASLAWVTIATDSNKHNNQSFKALFKLIQNEVELSPYDGKMSVWDYTHSIKEKICKINPIICAPYNGLYIPVLATCLLINEIRRTT